MIEVEAQQDLGRAKNAIQDYLVRKLLLPKIYFDAKWGEARVDVLAIDRGGAGDIHAVELAPVTADEHGDWTFLVTKASILINQESERLKALPMQFRYIALVSLSPGLDRFNPTPALVRQMLAADGVGRIGILVVDLSGGEPSVHAAVKPERFRSSKEIIDLADQFVAGHTANWEIRE